MGPEKASSEPGKRKEEPPERGRGEELQWLQSPERTGAGSGSWSDHTRAASCRGATFSQGREPGCKGEGLRQWEGRQSPSADGLTSVWSAVTGAGLHADLTVAC